MQATGVTTTGKQNDESLPPTLAPTETANAAQDGSTESTPLLRQSYDKEADTPLPKLPIFLLSLLAFSTTLTFSSLFPYINNMVWKTGVERDAVGHYVGWIEGFYSAVAALVMISWAKLSNRYGRKRSLLLCTLGSAMATACFGFSRTLAQMFFWRGLQGAFAGTVVITRTFFAELSTPSNQARAFSFYAFAGNASLFAGAALGGFLCEPERRLPNTFGKIQLLQDFPYALPGLFVASVEVLALILCAFFLTEPEHKEKADPSKSVWSFLNRESSIVLAVYVSFIFHGGSYTSLWPLWAFTDTARGGLSWDPPQIGFFSSVTGLFQAFWLLIIMPILDKRYGTRILTRICFAGRPLLYMVPILASVFAKQGNTDVSLLLVSFMSIFGSATSMGYTFVQLLLNQHSPAGGIAALNALALSLVQVTRTVAPGAVSTLEAISTERNILGGYLAWLVLICFGILTFVFTAFLPRSPNEKEGKGRV